MICLQRGCALSASLQYPRGTQVCNMKNTDANKQNSSHKQRPRLKVSILLMFNYVHKMTLFLFYNINQLTQQYIRFPICCLFTMNAIKTPA